MSQLSKKINIKTRTKLKTKADEEPRTPAKTYINKRSKKERLTGKNVAAQSFNVSAVAADVEIKTENDINESQAPTAPTSAGEAPAELCSDIKPDLNELNKELFGDAKAVVVPSSVLPTLFIFSQLQPAKVVNTTLATAAATGSGSAAEYNAISAVAGNAAAAANVLNAIGMNTHGATNTASFFEDVATKDEFDQQETDSDEDGFSDINFSDDDELVEDDEDTDELDPQWTSQPTSSRMVFMFNTSPQNVGLNGRPNSTEPSFYIDMILGSRKEFFTRLALSSNIYAQQQMIATNKVGKIYLKDISSEEMEVFFAICLQMSSIKLRKLGDYWSQEALWGYKGFASKMSLNRFQIILKVLSFNQLLDPTRTAGAASGACTDQDAFGAIVPLVEFFNARMHYNYNCGQRLVLNEPIVFWKGKFNWFNDMYPKFRCNAVLLHLLTERTGLIQKIVLDVERKDQRANVRNSKLLVDQRVNLAKEILREKLGKGHTIYASKYYASFALAKVLSKHQTYCTGFVDNKRYGNCKELVLTNLEKNTFATKYASSIMMGKWRKREKCAYFFSSDCLAIYPKETSIRTVDRRPKIIKELDWQLKLSEDIKEHLLTYQLNMDRKELEWSKQLVIYIFNLMVFNAYILYAMHAQLGRTRIMELQLKDTKELKTYAEFRQEFIASLLGDNVSSSSITDSTKVDSNEAKEKNRSMSVAAESEDEKMGDEIKAKSHSNLLEIEHMPMIIPRRKGKVMKKKCRICRKGGMLTFSKLCCEVCPGMPGLCETPCFKIWHEQLRKSLESGGGIKTRIFGTSGRETIYF